MQESLVSGGGAQLFPPRWSHVPAQAPDTCLGSTASPSSHSGLTLVWLLTRLLASFFSPKRPQPWAQVFPPSPLVRSQFHLQVPFEDGVRQSTHLVRPCQASVGQPLTSVTGGQQGPDTVPDVVTSWATGRRQTPEIQRCNLWDDGSHGAEQGRRRTGEWWRVPQRPLGYSEGVSRRDL